MSDAPPPHHGSGGSDGPPPTPPAPPPYVPPPGEPPFIPPMYRGGVPRGRWGAVILVIIVLAGAALAVWAFGSFTGAGAFGG